VFFRTVITSGGVCPTTSSDAIVMPLTLER
jgi:hypothetical protein